MEMYPTTRPNNRVECLQMDRPCPFISCKYHNIWWFFAANPKKFCKMSNERLARLITGHIYIRRRDGRIHKLEMPESCTLDCIDRYGPRMKMEWIGKVFSITRESVRQAEASALRRLQKSGIVRPEHGPEIERPKEPYLLPTGK